MAAGSVGGAGGAGGVAAAAAGGAESEGDAGAALGLFGAGIGIGIGWPGEVCGCIWSIWAEAVEARPAVAIRLMSARRMAASKSLAMQRGAVARRFAPKPSWSF